MISQTTIDFIDKWQTLIGSALGPFLAIILAALGFLLRSLWQGRSDRKETIRRAEIAFAQTLNDIFISTKELREFVARLKILIQEIQLIQNPHTKTLKYTNFPVTAHVQFDRDLVKMKFRSYYLHNKILISDHLARLIDDTFKEFKIEYKNLLRRDEWMMEKMLPIEQQKCHSENLSGFSKMVETFLHSVEKGHTESILQAKVYNLKLMKKYFWTLWKYEWISFKFFKNKKDITKYNGGLDAVDRINELMKEEVEELKLSAKKRLEQD